MDEAEKYQQRLQSIGDTQHKQQEVEKARREMEEDWRMQAHLKRKTSRDQWLSENPQSALGPGAEDFTELPNEKDMVEVKTSMNCTIINTQNYSQADIIVDGIQDIIRAAADQSQGPMATTVSRENSPEGRTVLGRVAVQVERDVKTGATRVRSVMPVSAAPGPLGDNVFSDSRKSVRKIGAAQGQPSAEELGQILCVIDRVGMQVLLDDAPVTPDQEAEGAASSLLTNEDVSDTVAVKKAGGGIEQAGDLEDRAPQKALGDTGDNETEEVGPGPLADLGCTKEEVEILRHPEDDNLDEEMHGDLHEGTVTLTFLGYTETGSQSGEPVQHGEVERVIISEVGEDRVVLQSCHVRSESGTFLDLTEQDRGRLVNEVHGGDLGLNQEEVKDDSPKQTTRFRGTRSSKHQTRCCSIL
ncbi:hypothetical protein UPYG_G00102220 [Umbra pygmaea]|uniref:Uncharacterized protein n=1 Tax=Umbra pygmaea TaxID=75934 RepID=A0ABD0X183_UMBPY